MGVNIENDCIKRPDGTLVCWDADAQKCYAYKKVELSAAEIMPCEWEALLKMQSKKKRGCMLSQDEVDALMNAVNCVDERKESGIKP